MTKENRLTARRVVLVASTLPVRVGGCRYSFWRYFHPDLWWTGCWV